jgi:hypothetical protein
LVMSDINMIFIWISSGQFSSEKYVMLCDWRRVHVETTALKECVGLKCNIFRLPSFTDILSLDNSVSQAWFLSRVGGLFLSPLFCPNWLLDFSISLPLCTSDDLLRIKRPKSEAAWCDMLPGLGTHVALPPLPSNVMVHCFVTEEPSTSYLRNVSLKEISWMRELKWVASL